MNAWKWSARLTTAPCRKSRFYRRYSTKSYADAITALNSLQSNAAVVEAIRKSGRGMNQQAIPEMLEWLRRAGYQPDDFNALNVIHIAGTKGKGSTAAFVSSILNQYRSSGQPKLVNKVGLYTSPHLRFVRERIQVDGAPLSEETFATYFFEIWDKLEHAKSVDPIPDGEPQNPVYFRYLTIMAFHAYLKQHVDAAVIECGIGGEHDSTNVISKPAVTGITSLGMDHFGMLGSTIESIAWHKAGILKANSKAFTSPQPKEAMQVLISRAKEKGVSLKVVDIHPQILSGDAEIGLNGDFQKINASLAIELAAEYLRTRGLSLATNTLPNEFVQGLKDVQWRGRCEIKRDSDITWYIDGAHTTESIQVTGQWYSSVMRTTTENLPVDIPRILLFNQQTRAGPPLLKELQKAIQDAPPFTHAIFCSNVTYASSGYRPDLVSLNVDKDIVKGLQVQKELAQSWTSLIGGTVPAYVSIVPTIEDAVMLCRELSQGWRQHNKTTNARPSVLATGSIHLIGGLLDVLEQNPPMR